MRSRPRLPAPALALALALLAGACGGGGTGVETVEQVIEEDWNAAGEGDATWPGRPELDGTTAEEVNCRDDAGDGPVRCVVRLASGGPTREVRVLARLDGEGSLVGWELEPR